MGRGGRQGGGPPGFASSRDIPGGADERICIGAITGAHGVGGAVRVKSFTADPQDVGGYGTASDEAGSRDFALEVIGMSSGAVLARIAGVNDRNAAEALKGTRLYVPRDALPPPEEEEFYHSDLLGLAAVLADGAVLGVVTAVHELGARDAVEISRDGGLPPVLVPFTRDAVPVVDIPGGKLVIDLPEGLLDVDDKPDEPD